MVPFPSYVNHKLLDLTLITIAVFCKDFYHCNSISSLWWVPLQYLHWKIKISTCCLLAEHVNRWCIRQTANKENRGSLGRLINSTYMQVETEIAVCNNKQKVFDEKMWNWKTVQIMQHSWVLVTSRLFRNHTGFSLDYWTCPLAIDLLFLIYNSTQY